MAVDPQKREEYRGGHDPCKFTGAKRGKARLGRLTRIYLITGWQAVRAFVLCATLPIKQELRKSMADNKELGRPCQTEDRYHRPVYGVHIYAWRERLTGAQRGQMLSSD